MQIFNLRSILAIALASLSLSTNATPVSVTNGGAIELKVAGTYTSGIFDEGAAETAAFDPRTNRVFVTNADANTIDVLSIKRVKKPRLEFTIDLSPYGGGVNSVAIYRRLVAVAVEADVKQAPGNIVFFNRHGDFLAAIEVGALPDMVTFTPDGTRVLVANEGEPSDDYLVDPEGSVSIIDISGGLASAWVTEVNFQAFNGLESELAPLRIYGPGASVAQDLEPEYIAVSKDSMTAWVSLQENNGLAIIDLASATVTDIVALGTKHLNGANAIDASNEDGVINIASWPVVGMYQPDAIASYEVDGETYIVSANEGDARDYDAYSEEARVKDVGDDFIVDPIAYPNIVDLADEAKLGRLKMTTATGDTDGDTDIDVIHAYGGRSFSIWNAAGQLVFDSGSDFERITSSALPENFNATNDENGSFDNRSDDKGPEPEGIALGKIDGRTYAFIGLERVGGIMVYDISNPLIPKFVQYINNRSFDGDAETGTAGDLGPEGLVFVSKRQSPRGKPLLIVTNEVSGTTTIYTISTRRGKRY